MHTIKKHIVNENSGIELRIKSELTHLIAEKMMELNCLEFQAIEHPDYSEIKEHTISSPTLIDYIAIAKVLTHNEISRALDIIEILKPNAKEMRVFLDELRTILTKEPS